MLDLKDLYNQRVANYAPNFKKVVLNPLEINYITDVANRIVTEKLSETAYKKDGASLTKRYINGLKGEAAVGKILNMHIIDPKVGVSSEFNVPDIPGYGIGVKTVDYEHFPVIPRENTYPQVICICHPSANDVVYVCGLASVETLNTYQHQDLLLDPNLKAKGIKTGFYGFHALEELTLESIKPFKGIKVEKEGIYEEPPKKKRQKKSSKKSKAKDEDDIDEDNIDKDEGFDEDEDTEDSED